jgi:hypothetical protein
VTARRRKKPAPSANPAIVVGQEYDVWITKKGLIYGIRKGVAKFDVLGVNGGKPYIAEMQSNSWLWGNERRIHDSDYYFTLDAAKARLSAMLKIRRRSIARAIAKLDAIAAGAAAGIVTTYPKER